MTQRQLVAVFDDDHQVLAATREARARGFHIVDVYTPFAVHGMDEAMGLKPSRLTWVCFVCGALGLSAALWFQSWTSAVSWPLNVGGKPLDSLPAWIPIAFEITVLFAALGSVLALMIRSRFWPGKCAVEPAAGIMDDRFALVVELHGALPDEEAFRALGREYGALEVGNVGEMGGRTCEVS